MKYDHHPTVWFHASRRSLRGMLALVVLLLCLVPPARADIAAARSALDRKDNFEALRLALEAAESSPVEAYKIRGEAYEAIGDPSLALGEYQRALSHAPNDVPLLQRIADLLRAQKNNGDAISYLETAYRLDASNEGVARKLIDLLDGAGDFEREIDVAQTAVKSLAAGDTRAWIELRLAYRLFESRRFDDARPLLEQVAKRDDATTQTLFYLAKTYSRTQQTQECMSVLDRALKIDPKSDDLILLRGDTLYRSDNYDSAYDEYWRLKEMASPYWMELDQKTRLATARYKNEIPDIIASQYGVVWPIALTAGALALVLVILFVMLLRNRN